VTWTKQRLDEMDAALTSIETRANHLASEATEKANALSAELKKRRADFETEVKAQLKAGESALEASKTQLDQEWARFEADLRAYVETVGADLDQKRATFADLAEAQAKAWGEAAEKLQAAAAELGAENRARIEQAIARLRADSTEAKAHLDEFRQAGSESWAAFSAALQISRKKFDEASRSAWEALKNPKPTIKS
jgi:hypothetical protein